MNKIRQFLSDYCEHAIFVKEKTEREIFFCIKTEENKFKLLRVASYSGNIVMTTVKTFDNIREALDFAKKRI